MDTINLKEDNRGGGLFARQGGKWTKRKDVFKRWLPVDEYSKYIEPFLGGGNILLDAPYKKYTIASDTDSKVITIFKDLQKLNVDDFINFEFKPNKELWLNYKDKINDKKLDSTTRFIMNMYIKLFSFNNMGKQYTTDKGTRSNKRLKQNITDYKDKLKHVKFYKKSYTEIIPKYDSSDSFFYCDPPYYNTSSQEYETGEINHLELFNILNNIKGYFLLSYNDTTYIRNLYKDYKITSFNNRQGLTGKGGTRVVSDLLISNY